jgi:site-specific DNA recombinase
MRAYGYCRVSTEGQAVEGVSLDAQRERIKKWCDHNDANLIEIFTDAGLSGGRADNRPGLIQALDHVCKGKGNTLVIYSLSRMARSVKDTLIITERLDRARANLVSLSEKIDTSGAAGKMLYRMLAVLAEFERDLTSERTKLAAAYKRSLNEVWSVAPFGRTVGPDGKTLRDDPAEQEAIAEVLALRAAGRSIREVVAIMNERGFPRRGGGKWHIASVQRLLARAAEASGSSQPATPRQVGRAAESPGRPVDQG